jgi:DNA-binding MarR family transcriptional regulator
VGRPSTVVVAAALGGHPVTVAGLPSHLVAGASGELVAAIEAIISASIAVTARTLARTRAASDLTLSQWRMLAVVSRSGGGIRLGALADAAAMSPPSASRMLARLAARDLVRSVREPGDRRAVRIEPTDRGATVVGAVLAERERVIVRALARAAPAPGLAEELERLVNALTEEVTHEDRTRRTTDGRDPAAPVRRHRAGRGGPRRRIRRPRP